MDGIDSPEQSAASKTSPQEKEVSSQSQLAARIAPEAARVAAGVIFGNRASGQGPLTPETQSKVSGWWRQRLAEDVRNPHGSFGESLKDEHYLGMQDVLQLLRSYSKSPLSEIPRDHPDYKIMMDYRESTKQELTSTYDELAKKIPNLEQFSNLTDVVSRVRYWLDLPNVTTEDQKSLQQAIRARIRPLISPAKEQEISSQVGFNIANLGQSAEERFVALYDYLADVVEEMGKATPTAKASQRKLSRQQEEEGRQVVRGGELARRLIEGNLIGLNRQGNGVDIDDKKLNADKESLLVVRQIMETYGINLKKPPSQILPQIKEILEEAVENAWDQTSSSKIESGMKSLWPAGHYNPGVILGVGVVLTEDMRGRIIESRLLEKAKDNIAAVDPQALGVTSDKPEYSLYSELHRIRSEAYQILKDPKKFSQWKRGENDSQIRYDWKELINKMSHAGLVMPAGQEPG